MAYKVNRVSPSSLAATELCPRFKPDGAESNEAAQEGILIHERLEAMVCEATPEKWPEWVAEQDLSADHKGLLETAIDELRLILEPGLPVKKDFIIKPRYRRGNPVENHLKPGLYPECEIETAPGRHGYIDLLVVLPGNIAVVVDYKMVRKEHDYILQLGAYCVNLHRLVPELKSFEARIIAPRLYGDPEVHRWTVEDLKGIESRIAAIEKRADDSANDPTIAGCPSDACQYCHWAGKCPYQSEGALQAASRFDLVSQLTGPGSVYAGEELTVETFRNPSTPAQRGLRRAICSFLEKVVKDCKDDDKNWAAATKDAPVAVPGWKIGWSKGRASLDKSRMGEIRNRLMTEFGMSIEEIFDVSTVDMTLLKNDLTGHMGLSDKDASSRIAKALDGCMSEGVPFTRWVQTRK